MEGADQGEEAPRGVEVGPGLALEARLEDRRTFVVEGAPAHVEGLDPLRGRVADRLLRPGLIGPKRHIRDQQGALDAAPRSLDFSLALYKQGAADYLTVVTSQTALLQTQLQALNLDTLQLTASVDLIRALGGGWEDSAPAKNSIGALVSDRRQAQQ